MYRKTPKKFSGENHELKWLINAVEQSSHFVIIDRRLWVRVRRSRASASSCASFRWVELLSKSEGLALAFFFFEGEDLLLALELAESGWIEMMNSRSEATNYRQQFSM